MEKPSSLARYALLRRRVHASWKTTLLTAIVGGGVLIASGLAPAFGVLLVLVLVFLVRPAIELYFSSQSLCPHCEADVFLELCALENGEGIEKGMRCPSCGKDATKITETMGPVIDVD